MACRVRMPVVMDLTRRLLPAVLVVLGFGWQCVVSASPAGVTTEEDHAKYCKCRNCRKESCCCGPRHSESSVSAQSRSVRHRQFP